MTDWDDAFQNGKYILGAETYLGMWQEKSAGFRAAHPAARQALSQPYGPHPREVFDLFLPEGTPKGVVIFIHGGYWLSLDQRLWSHLAAGPLAHGYAVAMPGYPLCPEVRIAEITQSIARAVTAIAERVGGDILVCGHSAGGHLTARMACEDTPLPAAARIRRYVSISGVHDLRPLTKTGMNETLGLSIKSAAAESPALKTPRAGVDLLTWVGAEERPEFLRQNDLLANIWLGGLAMTRAVHAQGHHHFSVIGELAEAQSPLTKALIA
jgi:pimeloyl-ACP methyl ester carboxylesterase